MAHHPGTARVLRWYSLKLIRYAAGRFQLPSLALNRDLLPLRPSDIRHGGFIPWAPREIAAAVPMATRGSITTVVRVRAARPDWCGEATVAGSCQVAPAGRNLTYGGHHAAGVAVFLPRNRSGFMSNIPPRHSVIESAKPLCYRSRS